MPITKKCLVCGKLFITSKARIVKGNGKFCSKECCGKSKRNRIERICLTCGKSFEIKACKAKYGKFCKAKCYYASTDIKIGGKSCRGKPKSEEHKRKISNTKKGVPRPPSDKYGMSEEARKRLSKERSGENCHWWKDGRTKLTIRLYHGFHYKKWRKEVFERDEYICQYCGVKGRYLEAHHKEPRSKIVDEFLSKRSELKDITKQYKALLKCKELWDISNGITLCKTCHITTDSYGIKALE